MDPLVCARFFPLSFFFHCLHYLAIYLCIYFHMTSLFIQKFMAVTNFHIWPIFDKSAHVSLFAFFERNQILINSIGHIRLVKCEYSMFIHRKIIELIT